MIDASHIKVHPHAAGAKGGNQEMIRSKGGLIQRYIWPWMCMVCRVRIIITDGTTADWTQAWQLISGIAAEYLLADKYDSDASVAQAQSQGMTVVIPPRKNRKVHKGYDKDLYKLRHLVENAFLHLKRWRGIASRYAKNARSFLAAVQIRCIALWANIS
ncbi:putative transposase for insertion sequence element [Holospora obtusa F1]|uniref:Transposase for insertion sequence element n=1 Tax=Holospora obtusa F1 TaxID=1399147 RepID=W6TGL2_HOLOB|nr:putative transposase for insertion sequence element [Holospora obtusa F1]